VEIARVDGRGVLIIRRTEIDTSQDFANGDAHFRWNAWGWFGGQIGATAWLLVGAAAIAPRSIAMALVWAGCFAVGNAIGILLWRQRRRLRPYTAIQLLVVACGVSGLVAWSALVGLRPDVLAALGWPQSYAPFLIVPATMGWFAFLERRARSQSSTAL
jgi:hypothetical protein